MLYIPKHLNLISALRILTKILIGKKSLNLEEAALKSLNQSLGGIKIVKMFWMNYQKVF